MDGRGVLAVAAAVLLFGCGSSSSGGVKTGPETSSPKGAGGQSGANDAGANAGAAGSGGSLTGTGGATPGGSGFSGFPDGEVPDCSVLVTQYANTIAGAQACDVNGRGQCQQMVEETLSACPSCKTYVNDAASAEMIRMDWMLLGCASAATSSCPPLNCPPATGGSCVASSSGGACAAN